MNAIDKPWPAPYSRYMALSRIPRQTQAILLMLGAILCFSLMDVLAKVLTQNTGLGQTLWARYAGQCLIVLMLIGHRKDVWKAQFPLLQIGRSVMLLAATGFFFSGIAAVGLASATALMNVNPVLITLGGALLLRERLGPWRAVGIVSSLAGAIIIIRPGAQVFTPAILLPLGGAICYAGYSLATRFVGQRESVWTSLLYTGLVGGLLTTVALPFLWQPLSPGDFAMMIGIGAVGTLGQLALIQAFSKAEAGAIAPFAYASLIFASVWGMLFFGTYPDGWTIAGSLIIALSGIFVWHRETRRNKAGTT